MHYRNGRAAQNGDVIVSFTHSAGYSSRQILRTGVLIDAVPGNDYCNGTLAPLDGGEPEGACLVDCLHIEDALAALGGFERPAGEVRML